MKKLINLSTYQLINRRSGLSQVEIMVAILVISIVILGVITTFSTIGKGIIVSKARTIANNLGQEKVEALKNVSYSRLLTTSQDDLDTYGYDNTNTDYTPETLTVGDISFTRRVTVWKAHEESIGSETVISTMSATAEDEGIKKIKIEVVWTEGGESKNLVLYNFRDDPNRSVLSGKIFGLVTTTGTAVGIASAKVEIVQDINKDATTSTTGYYLIKTTSPATVQVRASKDGYWDSTSANFSVNTNPQNLQLQQKLTGTVTGWVVINEHPVISQVCASTKPAGIAGEQEYVELFNPTTWAWLIGDCTVYYIDENNNPLGAADSKILPAVYTNTVIPPSCYFLIANTGAVVMGGTTYYADGCYSTIYEDYIKDDTAGGIVLAWADDPNDKIDSVAWSSTAKDAPSRAVEGECEAELWTSSAIMRSSYYEGTDYGWRYEGNAYDSNDNETDFRYRNPAEESLLRPRNSSNTKTVVSGTPAYGAYISANDGLSSLTFAYMEPTSRNAYFSISVATGSCTVYISSREYFREISNVSVSYGVGTAIPNSATSPQWPDTDRNEVILSSPVAGGVIYGGVVRGDTWVGVSGIRVEAGIYSATTDSSGSFSFSVDAGSYTVIANPDYFSASWTSGDDEPDASNTVQVTEGSAADAGALYIYPAGWVSGHTYNASGGNLPYITVRATVPAAGWSKDVLSETDGTYLRKGVRTGSCYMFPVLDAADSYTSAKTYPITVSQGVEDTGNNFTITSAWGKIKGTVSDTEIGGNITTGVLIVATTVAAEPPESPSAIDSSFRSGTKIYYGTVSLSDGTYEVLVRKGWTYNLRAWYTKTSGTSVTTKTKTGVTSTAVDDTTSPVTVNFSGSW
ncbi:MAG: hypothetical protein AB1349_07360 [Elusimicrobiota bacterium]